MKAQVLYGIGNINYADIARPVPLGGEALVRLTRCGICGSDIPRIFKTGAHNMPLVPGHEMSGIIEECREHPELVGKRTGLFPLIPCKSCSQCRAGHYEMCSDYNYMGSRCDGGFAEYIVAPVWNLVPVPDAVSDEDAAMLEPMSVAVHAMRQVGLLSGDVVPDKEQYIVVCGLGTIGLLVALFLKDLGCEKVFCIGNKDVQKQKLLKMGYSEEQFCDVRYADPVSYVYEKTGGSGADVYFECIGRSESYEQAVKCTGPLGKVMLVGNPASDMALSREVYWRILRNQMRLCGTWNSSFMGFDAADKSGDDWEFVLKRLEEWSLSKKSGDEVFLPSDLITHRFDLRDMYYGLDIMKRKSEEYVKIMIEIYKNIS